MFDQNMVTIFAVLGMAVALLLTAYWLMRADTLTLTRKKDGVSAERVTKVMGVRVAQLTLAGIQEAVVKSFSDPDGLSPLEKTAVVLRGQDGELQLQSNSAAHVRKRHEKQAKKINKYLRKQDERPLVIRDH